MDPTRWQRIKTIYDEAVGRPLGERNDFLSSACAGDETLQTDVQRLLDHHSDTAGLFALVEGPTAGRTPTHDLTGSRVGTFDVQALIGRGGVGHVYRAHDTRLGRNVAIKVLPEQVLPDGDRRSGFEREARVLASLNHPHIAAIHGIEESSGVRALVLELVDGETLADVLARGRIAGHAGLPRDEVLRYALQIA